MAFLIFYTIVLLVYASINYYIYVRGMQALPTGGVLKSIFPWVFWLLVLTYVAGRTLERIYLSHASDILVWTGSFWLAGMLYFTLAVVLFDLIRLANTIIPFYPSFITENYDKVKLYIFSGVTVLVAGVIFAGHINTLHPRITHLDLHIPKQANGMKELNAVLMSDIHLGTLIGNGHFEKIVKQVEKLNPDIILLAGDVLDEDLEPVLRQNIGQTLKRLQAPLGVYGVMGNHEYIGGAEPAYNYLVSHGLKIIRDSVVKINDSFYLIGREDRDKPRFAGRERKSLEEVVDKADSSYPLILIDHQPYYLEKAASLGIDLQLSGHTHHGQLWPLNYITSAIYTISYGYGKIGNMHAYVSNGVGTWGPPVRVGNRPEIVNLKITFEE
ncbi:MAG: metallophosphoesterase [Bacteroidetes bacterium]|nr:MAG: metallophosphoesterase [Bacteroidota bacterium]